MCPGLALAVACALMASGCLEPAAERVAMDERVGQARGAEVSVEVSLGHAAVRELEPSQAVLWQSAPSIEFELALQEAQDFELQIRNAMPASELTQLSGPAVAIEAHPRRWSTRATFTVSFSEPGSVRLAMADPGAGAVQPFRIGLMSDVQEAIDRVDDLYERMNEDPSIEFLLGAGDLTEDGQLEELLRFEEELLALHVPYYTTLGNHELGVSPPRYHDLYGRGSFSFVYRGARFTLLDSASATIDATVLEWFETWGQLGRDQFHVVAMHVPPIDPIGTRNGSFASRNEANHLFVRLLEADVDLTLYGHLHSYFEFENAGIEARISGGGGSIPERFDGIGRHYLTIDIDPLAQSFRSDLVQIDGDF